MHSTVSTAGAYSASITHSLAALAAMMPEYSLFFPVRKYRTVMQNCGWDVRLLPPQERILISCFLAFASLVSVASAKAR